jgi:hypothetical protein
MLMGCVQPTLMPNINSATARVLDAAGIQTVVADDAGCCGAIRDHLGDHTGALADMRRNIDAWWPMVEGLTEAGQVEAIVMNASGCGLSVKEYGLALAADPAYAEKARRISALTKDERAAARPGAPAAAAAGARPRAPQRAGRRAAGAAGLPPALHAAARAEAAWRGGDPPGRAGLRRAHRAGGQPPVLRLGRHLLGAAARAVHRAARPQAQGPGAGAGRNGGVGQHRLHPAPGLGQRAPGAPLDRGAGRGAGRTSPG